jgi:hypothetical protein
VGRLSQAGVVATPEKKDWRCKMPLSEHEQKILTELEESLLKQDPRFAKSVTRTSVDALARRGLYCAVGGFIIGVLVTLVFFTESILLGLVGVMMMMVSAFAIERNARLVVRASLSRQRHERE